MNTFMPAPVAKPNTGEQAVAARLRAGAHCSSSRVHACESSLAGLPGLYSGSFYSVSSMTTWPGTSIPNEREMDLEDLITSRSGDVLRLKAKADAAMPEMAKVWRDEARRAASDVARLVALREPATVAQMEAERGLS